MEFRYNRNEPNRNKNIRSNGREQKCNPLCQGNACTNQNPFIPERDIFTINPIEEEKSNDSLDSTVARNPVRNSVEEEFFPRFIQGNPIYHPEFRATQITRIQTTIRDEEEECPCQNEISDNGNVVLSGPPTNKTAPRPMQFANSTLIRPNLVPDRNAMLPHFAENDQFNATLVPFTPKREIMDSSLADSGDPGANVGYMKEFGNLVSTQLDNLETRFIIYKIRIKGSKSWSTILWKKKYQLLSIPLVLSLLWLVLLLGVLIGSVFCSGMEECPWAKGTSMAPRLLYSPQSVF